MPAITALLNKTGLAGLEPTPTVLETAALPLELQAYLFNDQLPRLQNASCDKTLFLNLPMYCVLSAKTAILLQFNTFGFLFFILRTAIIYAFTIGALELYIFAHRYLNTFLVYKAPDRT